MLNLYDLIDIIIFLIKLLITFIMFKVEYEWASLTLSLHKDGAITFFKWLKNSAIVAEFRHLI